MAFKVTVLIASLIAATAALPVDNNVEGERTYMSSEHRLSGASGHFRYPLSGSEYRNNERVLITAGFPENTVFILETVFTEPDYDTINFYTWSGDDLVLDKTFSGFSTQPKYFLPKGNFLITFESNGAHVVNGFSLRWAPLESVFLH